MATDVPLSAVLDLPSWFWGGDIKDYFSSARLQAERDQTTGVVTVKTMERVKHDRPRLVRWTEIDGPSSNHAEPFVGELEREALGSIGVTHLIDPADAQPRLEALLGLIGTVSATSLAAGFAAHQLQTMSASAAELDSAVQQLLDDLRDIRMVGTNEAAFPNASAHFVSRDIALLHRMKLAAVLLRLEHDDSLRNASVQQAVEANARGELVFAASTAHSDGVATLDAYLAPMFGAMTPFVWAFPATRASGTVIYALGSQVAGTAGNASEPLHVLPARGPDDASSAPRLTRRSAEAAIGWWAKRLDGLFGVLSDPAVFTNESNAYVPSKHLHAQLTIEQLFRRTGSIQRAHRDTDARRVLLFTSLDTLERLTSRTLTTMCTLSFAQRTLDQLRKQLSGDVGALLLPAADRAVRALAEVQSGFFLSAQLRTNRVDFYDTDGNPVQLSLEEAAAEYLKVLRNATHGHGSNRVDAKRKTDALLAYHDGSLPHDLALLGYLYLLDVLCHPAMLRRVLWDGGQA